MTYPLPGTFVDGSTTVPVSATNLNDYTTAITGLDTRAPIRGSFTNPNGNVTGSPGNTYSSTVGGAGATFWIKESGTGTTSGWVAVSSGGGSGGVPTSRLITTGTGLTGGGDLAADRTLAVVGDTTTQRVEVAKNGTQVGANARKRVNLIEGANVTITTADNSGSNQLDVTIAAATSGSAGIPASTINTKGDLIVYDGVAATPVRFPKILTDKYILSTSVTPSTGLLWSDVRDILLGFMTTKGDLIASSGTVVGRFASGGSVNDGKTLTLDSTTSFGMKWAAAAAGGVSSVNTRTGTVTLDSSDVGLSSVNNTSDASKPISTATAAAIGGFYRPSDHGLVSWTVDPELAQSSSAPINGTVYLTKLLVPSGVTQINKLYFFVATASSGITTGNEISIYDDTGAQYTNSVTQLATVVNSTGVKTINYAPGISLNTGAAFVWVSLLLNATTNALLARSSPLLGAIINVGLSATQYRNATNGTAQTVSPAGFTPSANAQSPIAWWMAFS